MKDKVQIKLKQKGKHGHGCMIDPPKREVRNQLDLFVSAKTTGGVDDKNKTGKVELGNTVVDKSEFHSKKRDAEECEHGKYNGSTDEPEEENEGQDSGKVETIRKLMIQFLAQRID